MENEELTNEAGIEALPSQPTEPGSPFRPPRRRTKASVARGHWALLGGSLVVFGLALVLSVRGEEQVIVPVAGKPLPGMCGSKMLLGMNCPGCGLTRCFINLAHGLANSTLAAGEAVRGELAPAAKRGRGAWDNLNRAWHYNPGGLVLFSAMLAQIPFRSWKLWRIYRGREPLDGYYPVMSRIGTWTLYAIIAALIGQWVIRTMMQIVG